MTFSQLKASILNNVRRQTVEYLTELPNIINDAQDQICQRHDYWFLQLFQTFTITVGVGSWWQINLPVGASYSTLPDDIIEAWELVAGGQNLPIEYMPYDQAVTLYPLPSALSTQGQIEVFSETPDYTGLILWPVPIKNTSVYLEWRAKSLPDWDGVSQTAHNVLTDQYSNVIEEFSIALSWKFYGMQERFMTRLNYAEKLAKDTLDQENIRKKFSRIKTLPLRKGLEIPRQRQIVPFRTPPFSL